MKPFTVDTRISNGHLTLQNLPFSDDIDIRVFIIPKIKLSEMSFNKIRKLTKPIKGNLSDDVDAERNER